MAIQLDMRISTIADNEPKDISFEAQIHCIMPLPRVQWPMHSHKLN